MNQKFKPFVLAYSFGMFGYGASMLFRDVSTMIKDRENDSKVYKDYETDRDTLYAEIQAGKISLDKDEKRIKDLWDNHQRRLSGAGNLKYFENMHDDFEHALKLIVHHPSFGKNGRQ
jgi:hypothetical protein